MFISLNESQNEYNFSSVYSLCNVIETDLKRKQEKTMYIHYTAYIVTYEYVKLTSLIWRNWSWKIIPLYEHVTAIKRYRNLVTASRLKLYLIDLFTENIVPIPMKTYSRTR